MDERERFIPAYGVHERRSIPAGDLLTALAREGWPTYAIDGGPDNIDAFFTAIRNALPLNPPVDALVWDALSDSLWEGLYQLKAEKVAIVWRDAVRLRQGDPDAYKIALEILSDLVFSLADRKFAVGHVTRLLVLLA